MFLPDKRWYPKGGGSLNEYTCKDFKLLRLQQAESTSSYPRGGAYINH